MLKSRKGVLGLIGGVIALALVLVITAVVVTQTSTVSAAPAAQTAPTTPTTSQKQAAINAKGAEYNQLLETFRKSLAGRLNVTEDQLDTAIGGAVSDTTAQMVKDGKLTQTQADHLNGIAKDGLKGMTFPPNANVTTQLMGLFPFTIDQIKQVESDVAAILNLKPADLESQLMSGKSLSEIATAQGVDIQQVKTTLSNSAKTQIAAAVKAGKLTQEQADQVNKFLPNMLDKAVDAKMGNHSGGQK
ncbi:MAG TPA: hypothetical protein VH186_10465 [Chloroflexia bacterium]|nr:hypothetical protein [Chloroflexia bacterium]